MAQRSSHGSPPVSTAEGEEPSEAEGSTDSPESTADQIEARRVTVR